MKQVTEVDLESRLYELEQQRMRLVKHRDGLIDEAETMIARANREFDELALMLGREINELRERLQRDETEAPQEPRPRRRERNSHKPPMLDGLDDDEQEHYQRLLARRKRK